MKLGSLAAGFGFTALLAPVVMAQPAAGTKDVLTAETYAEPPAAIRDAAMAPWWKNVSFSNIRPDTQRGLIVVRDGAPTLERLGRPFENLGGFQVDLRGRRARNLMISAVAGYKIYDFAARKEIAVDTPRGARVSGAEWSYDGSKLAYFAHFDDRTELWTADARTGRSAAATKIPVMPTLVTDFTWTRDGKLIATFVPDDFRAMPDRPALASSPKVQASDSKPTRLRTFASVLRTPTDVERYRRFATSQLAIVTPGGDFRRIGKPTAWRSVTPAPNGTHVRATVEDGPASYLVPVSQFGSRDILLDAAGKELKELSKRALQLDLVIPPDPVPNPGLPPAPGAAPSIPAQGFRQAAVDEGRRSLAWHPNGDGLVYLQLGPSGANRKDRVQLWKAPFGDQDVTTLYDVVGRITSVRFLEGGKRFFVTETVDNKSRLRLVDPAAPDKAALIAEGELPNLLSGPDSTVLNHEESVYATRSVPSSRENNTAPGTRVTRITLNPVKVDTVFETRKDKLESPSLLRRDGSEFVVTRQTAKEVPNSYLVTAKDPNGIALTQNVDYTPDLTQAVRETIAVTRPDGMKFNVRVTMTPGAYKRPAFFWFYPREFTDQAAYNRSSASPAASWNFAPVSGGNKAILLRAGYVLVEPDCPIFGPSGRQNDSYVPQLRNNLSATIDALDSKGIIDRTRLALGGHSYGAFSTVNAMIHTPFFKAGIAGDGNYLRALTPFGFQSEQRQLWEGREMYLNMSPLLYAEQLTGALLLYHGEEDQNMGTALINSERLFTALEALGKPAVLYVYPYEDHGQIARETVLDQWARWIAWLDRYLKPAPAPADSATEKKDGG
ncbi:MAG: prolyl oligopeptidase family serine peptidase [Fimbriimonadaceae bacterium]|nr:prolyl oligopeptidase family serine peptidase [Fimbriimonadaceae bacterium]